ncbi:MAG TPA: outer membrane lipoprotein carrier protein LolA [Candidatus Binataceae bacterium]|nr:outer membrane lipoprotein carrier protein LolA [Candidatus Binataceae bacterium]
MKKFLNYRFKFNFNTICAVLLAASAPFLFASHAYTQGHGAGDSLSAKDSARVDRIQDHYQHTTSFSAKFTEELTGVGATKRTRSGSVSYKRPGKMRWEFDAPQKETVVSDGHKLYDYQPDLNQVLEVPIDRAFKSAAPLSFLLGMGNLRRDFNVSLPVAASSDTLLRVVLTPKGGGDRIEMGLNPSTCDLVEAKVTNALGNVTAIRFSDVRTNVQLADAMFQFEVPPGADIVQAPNAPGAQPHSL